jgi:ribosomal-protein-alanine N-acetyltransferase
VVRLKAVVGEDLVGFLALDVRPSRNLAWIATIGVMPAYRRRGIASALLTEGESRLKVRRLRLSVRASNQAALHLYRVFGYREIDRLVKYYQGGEDAIVMEKRIGG